MTTEMERLIVAELEAAPGMESLSKRVKEILAAKEDHIRRLEERLEEMKARG